MAWYRRELSREEKVRGYTILGVVTRDITCVRYAHAHTRERPPPLLARSLARSLAAGDASAARVRFLPAATAYAIAPR